MLLKSFRRSLPVGLAQAALCLGCLQPCTAQPAAPGLGERPRIGLVLSGGGARGGAHLGVLKVLQELQVPVDVVVGTSAGAIIGAAYASGMPLAEIEAEMRPLHTATLFRDIDRSDLPVRRKADDVHNYIGPEVGINAAGLALPKGAVAGVSLEAVLRRLTARQHDEDFDRLPVRFRAVASDVTTAEMVVLGRGSLATAIRASMALPAIVNPVEVDGRLLVDGGVSRNLPVDVARALGADVVIAVNIGTPLLRRDELTSLLSVSEQMVRVLTAKNVNQSLQELGPQDVLITPELGSVTTADFDHLFEAASAGEKAARAAAGQLARWRVDASAYAALELRRITGPGAAPRVDEVRIVGLQRANPDAVRAALSIQPGDAFDAAAADADMRRLYASGDFERVSYHLGDSPAGGQVVTVDLSEKAWGPNYLRFGLELSSDFDGNSHFNLLLAHRRAWLNRLGAEWHNTLQIGRVDRLRTEWHQPLEASHQLFATTHAEVDREPFDLYVDGERIGRYKREQAMLGLGAGWAMGHAGELRASLLRGHVRLGNDTGFIPGHALVAPASLAGVSTRLRLDTLDSLRFPREGVLVDARYFHSLPGLGADDRYDKLEYTLQGALSRGAHTLRAAAFGTLAARGTALPNYELAQLGGFLRLSGYRTNEFLGTSARLARLVYAYRITTPGLLDGVHLGLSAEAGRVSDAVLSAAAQHGTLRSNAVFLAADTPVGPVYLGLGRASGGRSALYLYLGMP
jgi:NTE family protein